MGVENIFVSYYFIHEKSKKILDRIKDIWGDKPLSIMVDSGIVSIEGLVRGKALSFTKQAAEDYIKEYVKWLDENRSKWDACANFDADRDFGSKQIEEWDDKYFVPRSKDGYEVVYVWHPERGVSKFIDMVNKYDFVGTSTFDNVNQVVKFCRTAEKKDVRMHGFAFTRPKLIKTAPFYSVDSTTWTAGQRWGVSFLFLNGRLMASGKEGKYGFRKRHKKNLEKLGLDWNKLIADDYDEVNKMNIIAWVQWQKFYDKMERGKWVNEKSL